MSHSAALCVSLLATASISRPFQLARPGRSWHAMAASAYVDGLVYVWLQHAGIRVPSSALGFCIRVCPAKGRSTGGCESHPGKPPEEPGSQPPAYAEMRASKRGEANLQAVANANSAASKGRPVRDEMGRARSNRVKAAVRGVDSGSPRNLSGVWEMACREGWSVNWGEPPAPVGVVDHRGSEPVYKATPKSRAVRRQSERVVVPVIVETTELGVGKDPYFGDVQAAKDG